MTFFPAAIELCYDEFAEERENIPFQFEPPPNAPTTERAPGAVVLIAWSHVTRTLGGGTPGGIALSL